MIKKFLKDSLSFVILQTYNKNVYNRIYRVIVIIALLFFVVVVWVNFIVVFSIIFFKNRLRKVKTAIFLSICMFKKNIVNVTIFTAIGYVLIFAEIHNRNEYIKIIMRTKNYLILFT